MAKKMEQLRTKLEDPTSPVDLPDVVYRILTQDVDRVEGHMTVFSFMKIIQSCESSQSPKRF